MFEKLKDKFRRLFVRVEYVPSDGWRSPPSVLYASYEPLFGSTQMALTIRQFASGEDTMVRQFLAKDFQSLVTFLISQRVMFQMSKFVDVETFAAQQMDALQSLSARLASEQVARHEAESKRWAIQKELNELKERLISKQIGDDE